MSAIERDDIKRLIEALRDNVRSGKKRDLSRKLLKLVDVPARRRISVNLYKLDKLTHEGDSVIVPGKVLADGSISHKLNIAALEYSKGASVALGNAGAKLGEIREMLETKNVKIIV
jgi:large subunit ribosomal protein L18e